MQRPKINRIWTGNSPMMRRDPGDAKYQQGWVSEIPTYQVLNYLQYKIDTTILAQAERGVAEWGNDVVYGLGSLAWDNKTNYIYVAVVQQPDRNKAPSDNAAHWSRSSIQITRKEFDDIVTAINAHIANKANPHNLTAGQLNAYNKQEMDNLVAQYRALVSAHVNDKNNPHKTTAEQAGGVPITGGTYEGDVKFLKSIGLNADDTARLCNENGIYLEVGPHNSDVALVGITMAGEVVAGRSQSKSPIVTEKTFQDLKAENEPDYAVPLPTVALNFMRNINTQIGNVQAITARDAVYGPTGFVITGAGVSPSLQSDIEVPLAYKNEFTIAFDTIPLSPLNGANEWVVVIGMADALLALRDDGWLHCNVRSGSNTVKVNAEVGKVSRCVLTSRNLSPTVSETCMYFNGLLVSKRETPTWEANRDTGLRFYGNASTNQCESGNLRIWSQCLTPAQVSTL